MAKPYSNDLRARAIAIVEGGASRHEVAGLFEVSPSTVINWLRRWRDDGSSAAKPSGGSVSPLEEHASWLLALIAEQPDLTLDEAVCGDAQATHRRKPQCFVAFFHSARHHI